MPNLEGEIGGKKLFLYLRKTFRRTRPHLGKNVKLCINIRSIKKKGLREPHPDDSKTYRKVVDPEVHKFISDPAFHM
jgi:hypothetical protein